MKILQTTLKNWAILGISREQHTFNARALATFACYLLTNISHFIYLFYKDSHFREYIISIFAIFTLTTIAIVFTVIISQKEEIFELIDYCEEIIEKRKQFVFFFTILDVWIQIYFQDRNTQNRWKFMLNLISKQKNGVKLRTL